MGEWFFNPILHSFGVVENHCDTEMATSMSRSTAGLEEL